MIHDETRGIAETLTEVELSLAWPSISKSFGATGQFVWRGEKVDASVSSTTSSRAQGRPIRLQAPDDRSPLKAAFDGSSSHYPT